MPAPDDVRRTRPAESSTQRIPHEEVTAYAPALPVAPAAPTAPASSGPMRSSHRFSPVARPQPAPTRGKTTTRPSARVRRAASSVRTRPASVHHDQPGPKAPTAGLSEL